MYSNICRYDLKEIAPVKSNRYFMYFIIKTATNIEYGIAHIAQREWNKIETAITLYCNSALYKFVLRSELSLLSLSLPLSHIFFYWNVAIVAATVAGYSIALPLFCTITFFHKYCHLLLCNKPKRFIDIFLQSSYHERVY